MTLFSERGRGAGRGEENDGAGNKESEISMENCGGWVGIGGGRLREVFRATVGF